MSSPSTPLYLRWLWWKHTWLFQLAHKPLCERFHRDVFHWGRLHVCRSCTLLYGTLVLGLAVAPLYRPVLGTDTVIGCGLLLLAVVVASAPPLYDRTPRVARDLLRAALGFLSAIALVAMTTSAWPWALMQLVALALAWVRYHRMRDQRTADTDLCAGCAERGCGRVCTGFSAQADRLRAYEEAATDWLEKQQATGHS